MRLAGLLSLAIAGVALTLIAKGGDGAHIKTLIASALGVGFSVMLAAALTLIFLNNKAASDSQRPDKKDQP
jgi:hypothetical protein